MAATANDRNDVDVDDVDGFEDEMGAEPSGAVLTVRETLAMPAFAQARVVAGQAGLERPVRRVHIVDLPGAAYEWGTRDVLLLTAGVGLADDLDRQAALVPDLVGRGVAGMVLSVGYIFDNAPQVMRDAADELGFPLVTTPPSVRFIELTEAIWQQLVNRRYAVLRRSSRVHDQLTELALRGGTLDDVASALADVLGRSVTIENASLRSAAVARRGAVDVAWQRSAAGGGLPATAGKLLSAHVYDRLRASRTPVRVVPIPQLDMTMQRIVAPIVADGEIHGYLWVLVGDDELTEVDELAIEHGATVSALILLKELAAQTTAATSQGDFLEQVLASAGDAVALAERAHQLGFRLDRAHAVICIRTPVQDGATAPLERTVTRWLRSRGRSAISVWRDDVLVVVLESADGDQALADAVALSDAVDDAAGRPVVGVGDVEPPDTADIGGRIRRSYEQAREALHIAISLKTTQRVVGFRDLGLLHWLWHLPAEVRTGNRYLDQISTLAAYDRDHHSDLVASLEAYLDHGGSLAESATVLYVHRNTLLARVHRIEQVLDLDLGAAGERLNLHVALKAYRLHCG